MYNAKVKKYKHLASDKNGVDKLRV